MRSVLSCTLLAIVAMSWLPETAHATEATIQSGGKLLTADKTELQKKAETVAEGGRQSLQMYRKNQPGNPDVLIDAALAFDVAHRLYQQIGDQDSVAEMQANLFWCKKQMNLETLKKFLAKEGKRTPTPDTPVEQPAKPGQTAAEAALASAKDYAKEHGDELNAVAKRFGDVATRFPSTPSANEAQKLAAEYQEKYDAWIKAGGNLPQTIFTKPRIPKETPTMALPDEKSWRASVTELKKVFAKDYAKRTNPQKRAFALKLLAEAKRAKNDAALHYAEMIEAVRLAQETEDFALVVETIDNMSGVFIGWNAAEEKKVWLRKSSTRPAASAILTLLDTPRDEAANAVAGKYFTLQLEKWKEGAQMMLISNDPELKALGELELIRNQDETQAIQLGDMWYAMARKTGNANEKNTAFSRAQTWYQRVRNPDAITKSRITQRLTEIDQILPLELEGLNFDTLTSGQWNKLPGNLFPVSMRVDRSGPLIALKPGQRVRLIPNAEEAARFGMPLFCLDKRNPVPAGILTGPGNVWAIPLYSGEGENRGVVRVKIMPLEDE